MTDENNNIPQAPVTADTPYSENAVTGSVEDALKDRDVTITTTDTQKITVPTEEEVDAGKEDGEGKEEKDKAPEETDKTEEAALAEEVTNATTAADDLKKDLTGKGLDFDAMVDEYSDTGDFSQETRDALEKAGYPESVVNAFIAGLEATAEKIVRTVFDYCGGEDEYTKITQFVETQGKADIDRFNHAIESGDIEQMKLAIDGYKARMGARTGVAGRSVLGGNGTGGNANKGFSSKRDMVQAMSDPRYGRDPSYTKDIQRKTMNSDFF